MLEDGFNPSSLPPRMRKRPNPHPKRAKTMNQNLLRPLLPMWYNPMSNLILFLLMERHRMIKRNQSMTYLLSVGIVLIMQCDWIEHNSSWKYSTVSFLFHFFEALQTRFIWRLPQGTIISFLSLFIRKDEELIASFKSRDDTLLYRIWNHIVFLRVLLVYLLQAGIFFDYCLPFTYFFRQGSAWRTCKILSEWLQRGTWSSLRPFSSFDLKWSFANQHWESNIIWFIMKP